MITMQKRWNSKFFFQSHVQLKFHIIWIFENWLRIFLIFQNIQKLSKIKFRSIFEFFAKTFINRENYIQNVFWQFQKNKIEKCVDFYLIRYIRKFVERCEIWNKKVQKKIRLEIFDVFKLERKKKFTTTQQYISRLISSFIYRFIFEIECYHLIYVAWIEKIIESFHSFSKIIAKKRFETKTKRKNRVNSWTINEIWKSSRTNIWNENVKINFNLCKRDLFVFVFV